MRFLVDATLSKRVADALTQIGRDAVHVSAYGVQIAADDVVFNRATLEDHRVLEGFERMVASRPSHLNSIMQKRIEW